MRSEGGEQWEARRVLRASRAVSGTVLPEGPVANRGALSGRSWWQAAAVPAVCDRSEQRAGLPRL